MGILNSSAILVSDGAWGTELTTAGMKSGDVPELWNVENPDAVRAVAASYVEAGSDIILTNTFGGSPFKLEKTGLAVRVEELNSAGVRLSKEAAGDKAKVFASIGSTGEFMAPLGLKTEEEFLDCFKRQIGACMEGGADGVVIETMTDLGEAICGLKAARAICDLPVVVSMTYAISPAGIATMMGVTPADAAKALTDAGADAVGANCGAGIALMKDVAAQMHEATDLPLWIKANAGMPELVDGETSFRETPEEMVSGLPELLDSGARIVGGCCGTTPDHIRAICMALNA